MKDMKTIYSITVGNNIKKYREMNLMTQTELAAKLNIPQPTLNRYEKGERQADYEGICKICNTLNITASELFATLISEK